MRLADNQALAAALKHGQRVMPVFVLDPALWASLYVGEKRLAWVLDGLRDLDADLRQRGSRLIVRRAKPVEALAKLVQETGAEAIFAEADISPYARRRDARVTARLPLKLTLAGTVHPPGAVLKKDATPYIVYTPFSRVWKALPRPDIGDLLPAPERLPLPPDVASETLPEAPGLPATVDLLPGESEALQHLRAFTSGPNAPIYMYEQRRDRMDLEGTSKLSPYLRFGMLSARRAVIAAQVAMDAAPTVEAREQALVWLNELIWREFYQAILYHFPYVRGESFRENLRNICWENDQTAFEAWCTGRTGYPVIDAAMRQLRATGWMHNRARMIVASFLTKDLLIDWRWGERYFMQHLIDGDPASNNGGWQWSAGTGTDAAPYFRIMNPTLQAGKFDPQGNYVRRWLPELRHVPDKFIHEPWAMPAAVQQRAACVIGVDYPAPLVDHRWARERALSIYREARAA